MVLKCMYILKCSRVFLYQYVTLSNIFALTLIRSKLS